MPRTQHTCYVCGRRITGKALYVCQGLYRHPSRCEPGSARYMRNPALAAVYNSILGRNTDEGGIAMKKAEVKVGGVYAAKVSEKVVPVRIDGESVHGGWVATNLVTRRQVRIKSARRLRGHWPTGDNRAAQGDEKPAHEPKDAELKKRATRANVGAQERKTSGLDAAAKVLEEAGEPLSCKAIVDRALDAGYWHSNGKTPAATIYAAILREIQKKGADARFRKAGRGLFALAD